MKWKVAFFSLLVAMLAVQCSTSKEASRPADRIRHLRSSDVSSYHQAVKLEVAWIPYTEHTFKQTAKNEWKVVESDDDKKSAMPLILVSYPGRTDSLWLDMNTKNETLGRLLKHTLMTQEPISRPFTEYVEIATCTKCHPSNIYIDF